MKGLEIGVIHWYNKMKNHFPTEGLTMNMKRKMDIYPIAAALLGGVGYLLRRGLYAVCVDEKNLLVRSHPLEWALWLCTAAALALAVYAAFREGKCKSYEKSFSASMAAAFGHILAGSGILLTVLLDTPAGFGLLPKLWKVFGLLSAPALYLAAFSRTRGKKPFFGLYGVVSLFFALHLVAHYQSWCADPQLQNYVFSFLGMLALMLLAYHQCAFCVDGGDSRLLRLSGLAAVYLCITALAKDGQLYLYGGCAVWALTGLCRANPRKDQKAGDADESA